MSLKGNLIIIATDDQATFYLLNLNWLNDSFLKGIRMLDKNHQNKNLNKTLIIKGVHPTVDINDQEIADQLKEQGHWPGPLEIMYPKQNQDRLHSMSHRASVHSPSVFQMPEGWSYSTAKAKLCAQNVETTH